jgi:hypothetical protein
MATRLRFCEAAQALRSAAHATPAEAQCSRAKSANERRPWTESCILLRGGAPDRVAQLGKELSMDYPPDNPSGPTEAPPKVPGDRTIVGGVEGPPGSSTIALRGGNCISFADAARRKRKLLARRSRQSAARPWAAREALPTQRAPVIQLYGTVVLGTRAMQLRFGGEERVGAPGLEPIDEL